MGPSTVPLLAFTQVFSMPQRRNPGGAFLARRVRALAGLASGQAYHLFSPIPDLRCLDPDDSACVIEEEHSDPGFMQAGYSE